MSAERGCVVQILDCGMGPGPPHPGTHPTPTGRRRWRVPATAGLSPGCGLGARAERGAAGSPAPLLAQPPGLWPLGRESGLEAGVETSGRGGTESSGNSLCDLGNCEDAGGRA